MGTELRLVRHVEPTWNSVRRLQGGREAFLSARGRTQARALAAELAPIRFVVPCPSPLSRARATAKACGAALGLGPVAVGSR